jgi:hypothetical protein
MVAVIFFQCGSRSALIAVTLGVAAISYFFSVIGSTLLITIAVDPPRWNTLPLTLTVCPAKGSSLSFWLLDGVVSAIGQ